jgi:hypothetical protein
MAAAQNGTLSFLGASGRTYNVDMYTSDAAAGTQSTFNPSGLAVAGSLNYWRAPEAVTLIDFAMHTGTTQTGMVLTQDGAVRNGGVLKFVPFLDTIANRPKLAIAFPAGSLIGAYLL